MIVGCVRVRRTKEANTPQRRKKTKQQLLSDCLTAVDFQRRCSGAVSTWYTSL